MKKVLFVSGYFHNVTIPFGSSLNDIVCCGLASAGIKADFAYANKLTQLNPPYDFTIFAIQPEVLDYYCYSLLQDKNLYGASVLWNLEPLGDGRTNKYGRRKDALDRLIGNGDVQKLLVYDDHQKELYFNSIWCPIGYDECLAPQAVVKKTLSRESVFLGYVTGYRKTFFTVLKGKIKTNRLKEMPIVFLSNVCCSREEIKTKISGFKIGIDICGNKLCYGSPRWHRLMVYSACNVAIFTSSDLSKYGFIDGVDHIRYENSTELAFKMDKCFSNQALLESLCRNMLEKVKKNFGMGALFKRCLGELC